MVCLAWALLLTAAVTLAAVHIENVYLEGHSYFFDPAAYQLRNARLHQLVKREGRLATAWREWTQNERDPLRTAPLVLLAPGLLGSRFGHLATAVPALLCFLFLLGRTINRRTKSVWHPLAVMALFAAVPGLYNPFYGFAPYWLDLPSALWLGSAALCLLNATSAGFIPWLACFSILVSFAALSRWYAAVYALMMCGPVLAFLLVRRAQAKGFKRGAAAPLFMIAAITGLLAGPFVFSHLWEKIAFCRVYSYASGLGMAASLADQIRYMAGFLTPRFALAAAGLLAINLIFLADWQRRYRAESLCLLWMALAHPLLLVWLEIVGHSQAALFALPPMFILVVAPLPWKQGAAPWMRSAKVAVGVAIALGLLMGIQQAASYAHAAARPSREAQARKQLDTALAERLVEQGGQVVWVAFFDEYAWIPSLEAFYRWRELPLPAGQDYFFGVHETMWKGNFPGMSPEKIAKLVYYNVVHYVDVAVVFSDPRQAKGRFNNPYSEAAAHYMSARMAGDAATWKPVFRLEDTPYGPLTGFRNQRLRGDRVYNHLLAGGSLKPYFSPPPVASGD